ncbi:L-dopachrome tautomerase-related protein [Ulvibacterium sp.]|uniref:L-dopachrome tautomerase-related protein n=1 Tax=Ulvibacterium sp. TaxID=2665914 RepID=UPI00263A2FB8|nr:L-dopachrome tautomerase-related protein [Ulvibacterium sp.]
MKTQFLILIIVPFVFGCRDTKKVETKVIEIAAIKGQQLTGVTVSKERMFVNFPRWRKGIKYSVAEIDKNNTFRAYPSQKWNTWKTDSAIKDSVFIAVQSVVASDGLLYVVDTRNPEFQGVIGAPIIFVFDLNTDEHINTYRLPNESFRTNSYINDIRIDEKRKYAFLTDSGSPGLLVLNLRTGDVKRVLDKHQSTTSEFDFLTIDGQRWNSIVHSDGIALDIAQDELYFHALTGYSLYAISVEKLINGTNKEIEGALKLICKTTAPDGMIIHGNLLYFGDLEHHKILQLDLRTKKMSVLIEGDDVAWADTFSIENNELYYTNSRIHEANGNISNLIFNVNKIVLSD